MGSSEIALIFLKNITASGMIKFFLKELVNKGS
jgi:hypothetical protein